MAVGDNLHDFLSQPGLASRLASDVRFQESCGTIAQIAAKHSVAPLVLREEDCSTRQVFEVIRNTRSGYAFLQFPATLLVDKLPEKASHCLLPQHRSLRQNQWADTGPAADAQVRVLSECGHTSSAPKEDSQSASGHGCQDFQEEGWQRIYPG